MADDNSGDENQNGNDVYAGTAAGSDPQAGALSDTPTTALPLSDADVAGLSSSGIAKAYNDAIAQLQATRGGLTSRQMLGAALIGFGQPTRHRTFGEGAANASALMLKYTTAQQQKDADRQAKIAELMAKRDVGVARADQALAIAKLRAGARVNKNAQGTVHVLPSVWPGAPPQVVLDKLDENGNHVVQMLPVGGLGSTPLPGGAPTSGAPAAGATPPATDTSPFPVKTATGLELKQKYGIGGYDPNGMFTVHLAGPDAGKVEPAPAQDALAQYGGATGQALLNMLSPGDRANVEAMARGEVAPPTAGTRSPTAQRILQIASAAFPGVDFARNYKTKLDFSSGGKAGQNIIRSGTAIDHAALLYDSVDKLGNVSLGPLTNLVNRTKNAWVGQTDPAIKTFLLNRDQFVKELETAIKGSGNSSLAEFRDWKKDLDAADSPDVLKGAIRRGIGLLGDRLQQQVEPYNQTLGESRSFLSFLPPATAQRFMQVNPDYELTDDDNAYLARQKAQGASKAPTASASKPPGVSASAAPAGMTRAQVLAQARAAIASGKDRNGVIAKVRSLGFDPTGL